MNSIPANDQQEPKEMDLNITIDDLIHQPEFRARILALSTQDGFVGKYGYNYLVPEYFAVEAEEVFVTNVYSYQMKYGFPPAKDELLEYTMSNKAHYVQGEWKLIEFPELADTVYELAEDDQSYAESMLGKFIRCVKSVHLADMCASMALDQVTIDDVQQELNSLRTLGQSSDWNGCAFTMLDVKDYDPAGRRYLVEKLISERSSVCFWGEPKSLKTMLIWDLAVCLHLGIDWLAPAADAEGDVSTVRPLKTIQSNVLIVDLENGRDTVLERWKALAKHYDMVDSELANIPCVSLPRPLFDVELLIELIRKYDTKVVIIDPLLKAAIHAVDLKNENDNAQMQKMISIFDDVIEATGVTIIAIHHANRGGTIRGASALAGGMHTLYSISRVKGQMPIVQIEYDASRYAAIDSFSAEFRYTQYPTEHLESCYFAGIPNEDVKKLGDKTAWLKEWYWTNRESLDGKLGQDVRSEAIQAALNADMSISEASAYSVYRTLISDGRWGSETGGRPKRYHSSGSVQNIKDAIIEASAKGRKKAK